MVYKIWKLPGSFFMVGKFLWMIALHSLVSIIVSSFLKVLFSNNSSFIDLTYAGVSLRHFNKGILTSRQAKTSKNLENDFVCSFGNCGGGMIVFYCSFSATTYCFSFGASSTILTLMALHSSIEFGMLSLGKVLEIGCPSNSLIILNQATIVILMGATTKAIGRLSSRASSVVFLCKDPPAKESSKIREVGVNPS
ncbi:hypothetical protein PIB30_018996 [Stylosanthes scabra]|uniref:Uncharacterized protein n=1 Tax=Stylosanthes scabra TaxID=79078 RepID=A0ABU6Q8Y8_9FABA|nr:hypothetical protein [Stylosanthes scabra]